ncbi:TaqI-like C-terminal specificity domain-containing protein [Flavobacterium sp. 83]|uniref:Eco57I restriction-modification methylase domain-containing protein n=1 Tax=Flavobacterium sp. 83 TaxID=1131812 RepID=UPI00068B3A6A|nr:TaqI-like C-terminal specificity domain-containing protein [Flavobacterium sp. 83]
MPLFQNSVVTKQLQSQDKIKLVAQWNVFKEHFHNPTIQDNIRSSKEEQYQGEFLIDLFVNVLGYTKNPTPNYNLTTEYKNVKDSKKADGAILIKDKVTAVIELKGTNTTDLNKIEVQAFGYKNNQPDCVYVITANFEKLRFYIDNATEYVEFNLFSLTLKEFELLYLCLAYENIANDIPKKLKEQSLSQEKDITKKLYSDYSLFKRELHQDLVKQNPDFDALELFQKSQKLLDRFLFIFFAEDRNLLPTNLIFRINQEWRQLQEMRMNISLYDRYKIYFNDLNQGAKVVLPAFSETRTAQKEEHQIFAYNGGLFHPDAILDHIKIDDELLYKHTQRLSNYDFQSEVDVNILGHIFENSLNELDEITNATMGLNPLAREQTKRKKDGVFYTPKYITKYIVDNTVGKLCIDKKAELKIIEEDYVSNNGLKRIAKKIKQPLLEKLNAYRNWLLQITICDPACGSGAFLNQALEFLIAEHGYIDELQAKLFGDAMVLSDVEKSILENNLFGVDLNEESVEIAKLSLWLRTAQPNRKLNDLNSNIKCGNSLIDDETIAGDKAFNWQTAFPKIFTEKQKKPWHITTAIHDSRTSQRMIDYKVREKRAMGTMPEPQINYLTDNDEMVIAETVSILVNEQHLNILAFNICKDHIHIVLVCEEEEVNEIVRKIKGRTAREVNKNNGINPIIDKDYNNGFKPIVESTGEKSIPLWTQKFGCKEIVDENQLTNTINYIKTNRAKHNLPDNSNKGFKSLVDSISCTYEHAFREEYKGGFDVIIGNPPYVNSKEEMFTKEVKEFFIQNYKTSAYQIDLYILFLEKSLKLISNIGTSSLIVPNSWLNNLFLENVRKFFLTNSQIIEIVSMPSNTFLDANVDTIIVTFENSKDKLTKLTKCTNEQFDVTGEINQMDWFKEKGAYINVHITKNINEIFKKLNHNSISLEALADIGRGVGVYHKRVGHTKEFIEKDPFQSDKKDDATFLPYLRGRNVQSGYLNWNNDSYISYGRWLAEPRDPKFFTGQRIVLRQIPSKKLIVAYLDQDFVIDQSVFIARFYDNSKFNSKSIMSILGSKLMAFYFKFNYSEFDDLFPKVKLQHFKSFPISEKLIDIDIKLGSLSNEIIEFKNQQQEQSQKFQRTIQRKFFSTTDDKGFKPLVDSDSNSNSVLPKKLQDWYLLSYADFIKELAKKKIKLALSQEAEWEEYFTTEAKKVLEIKTQIYTTDKAIDAMIYELYGLSSEEIEIVENS